PPNRISVLVAGGTHRRMTDAEIGAMFDERVHQAGIAIRCHDAFDPSALAYLGTTRTATDVTIERGYLEADLRILTGLVESHLMAGASGGRKSICPGILGIDSIREFHGPMTLADPRSTDLVMAGNPCHELSLEIARMAPADFILNITAGEDGAVTGVFAGDMERAHEAAVEHLHSVAAIPIREAYDLVVTHAGRVGVNHYQAAKAAVVATRILRPGGHLILVANTVDPDPVGSEDYRALLIRLRQIGPHAFRRLISSPDWTFVHDQWEVQMWAKVLQRVPPENLFYFSPQTTPSQYANLPCRKPGPWMAALTKLPPERQIAAFVSRALKTATDLAATKGRTGSASPRAAFLPAGPCGIPCPPRENVADYCL
ncbi:MAG TPA: lactate racemase domain-containing protein, partial [Thermoleophilia bacterium]|nr:lactate racemase domain-containing protein [Thermoleophilia bacterium]